MTTADQKRLRKCVLLLKNFRDEYAKNGDSVTSAKFSRAAALIIEILNEEKAEEEFKKV